MTTGFADVRETEPVPGRSLPLVVEPAYAGFDLVKWAADNRPALHRRLARHGGILFRGFTAGSVEVFHHFITAASGEPLPYLERSSPRREVEGNVYTSTEHPANEAIFLHNEQSYNLTWPLRIFFHCTVAPAAGGATPVADCRRVYQRISARTRDRFAERGYRYVRNFGSGFGLGWREAFQTDDRATVERYCEANGIEHRWLGGERLSTAQVRAAVHQHPESGETTWFNHVTFFHVSTLDPVLSRALLSMGRDRLPNNTYYGDGTEIEPEVLDELRAAYHAETVVFPWREGDILMLDNMLAAHGREAFTPPRRILVGMTQPVRTTP
ncbi:TauD/TfdA family dioxygenase [Plantactinospora sp. CA-294935]|uniref:TauD/TfdA family dioxygenase n=1 Tax=Plantactinospora sp. CA-294935 TaxID=3240012 RepID=UPI003D8A6313